MSKLTALVSRDISEEELANLAQFPILWPQHLPEGYTRRRILEYSSSEDESSGTGIFFLEFTDHMDNVFLIKQSKSMKPNHYNKRRVGSINVMDARIPVFEEGDLKFAYFERDEVHVEFVFHGTDLQDVEDVALSLSA